MDLFGGNQGSYLMLGGVGRGWGGGGGASLVLGGGRGGGGGWRQGSQFVVMRYEMISAIDINYACWLNRKYI